MVTFTEAPILDRDGLPRLTTKALILVDPTGRELARHPFNTWSGCSRLVARRRLSAAAKHLSRTPVDRCDSPCEAPAVRSIDDIVLGIPERVVAL